MGLKKFIVELIHPPYQQVASELLGRLGPLLKEAGFEPVDTHELKKNESTWYTWGIPGDKRYVQVGLFRMSGYYKYHEAIDESEPDYTLDIRLGEGGFDFWESKWSGLPLMILVPEAEEHYRFNDKPELMQILDRITRQIQEGVQRFLADPDEFYRLRSIQVEQREVRKVFQYNSKTGEQNILREDEQDKMYKELYR